MVTSVTSMGRNGVRDWLVQRVSALLMLAYLGFILVYVILHPGFDYNAYQLLFSYTAVRLFTLLFIASLLAHAWIGMWTVATDYIKAPGLRLSFYIIVLVALAAYFIWSFWILWG